MLTSTNGSRNLCFLIKSWFQSAERAFNSFECPFSTSELPFNSVERRFHKGTLTFSFTCIATPRRIYTKKGAVVIMITAPLEL